MCHKKHKKITPAGACYAHFLLRKYYHTPAGVATALNELRKVLEPYYSQVIFWLLNAPEKERELERKRKEIIEANATELVRIVPKRGHISDPTGNKACRLLQEIAEEEQWICLVREVEQTEYGPIIKLRRMYGRGYRGRPVWRKIANKLHYSESHVKNKWRDAVIYTAFLALSRGLLKKDSTFSSKKCSNIVSG